MKVSEAIKILESKVLKSKENLNHFHKESQGYAANEARIIAYNIAINKLEQIDEPQAEKVEVPDFVAEWYESNKYKLERAIIDVACSMEKGELPYNLPFEDWFIDPENHPIETLISMMKDGYTVNPKRWVVKRKNGSYVNDFQEAKFCVGIGITLEMDCLPPFKFTDKSKAEAVATLVEGSVEEID